LRAIAGRDEGIYAWVSANYALGTLHGDPLQTTGIIELGGASTQVTFVPEVLPPPSFKHTLELGGKAFVLYSYSFLNFGQEAAWDSLLELMIAGSAATASKKLLTSVGLFFGLCFVVLN
jgi:apyrase